jgi:hypothetical protein
MAALVAMAALVGRAAMNPSKSLDAPAARQVLPQQTTLRPH